MNSPLDKCDVFWGQSRKEKWLEHQTCEKSQKNDATRDHSSYAVNLSTYACNLVRSQAPSGWWSGEARGRGISSFPMWSLPRIFWTLTLPEEALHRYGEVFQTPLLPRQRLQKGRFCGTQYTAISLQFCDMALHVRDHLQRISLCP